MVEGIQIFFFFLDFQPPLMYLLYLGYNVQDTTVSHQAHASSLEFSFRALGVHFSEYWYWCLFVCLMPRPMFFSWFLKG